MVGGEEEEDIEKHSIVFKNYLKVAKIVRKTFLNYIFYSRIKFSLIIYKQEVEI